MKIVLFDTINETHVCDAFAFALRSLGHEVTETGPVWRGHRFPKSADDMAAIDAAVEGCIGAGFDVFFNFRASALRASQVERLREAGMATFVWLPDDPVLYGVTYRAIAGAYDRVLHCGTSDVLAFYDSRGHAPGVNFPFWLDPQRWAADRSPETASRELVFLGNLHGPAKKGRYEMLASAAGRLDIYGICREDPRRMHRGELYGVDAIRAILPAYIAGISIRQRFSDYAGAEYDFDGLAALGEFDLPSRVLQYAALSLPVISLGASTPSAHFRPALQADGIAEALSLCDRLSASGDFASRVSSECRREVVEYFSAVSRARYLEALVSGQAEPRRMSLVEREHAYRSFKGSED